MKQIVITISREFGSGCRIIAQQLADELGITFYDKQLISEVAKQTGFTENFIRSNEHKRPTNSFLYDLYSSIQIRSIPDQVFVAQTGIIREIAARESCIIVGRCADYILRENPNCLKVFVFAPLEERVRRASEEYGVKETGTALENYVLRQDKSRAAYYNYFTTDKWGDSRIYDLCVNSRMGIETVVKTIKLAAKDLMDS